MYRKKVFSSPIEAIRYTRERGIIPKRLVYIASKGDTCELVYKKKG